MPIRFLPMTANRRVFPLAAVKAVIGRGLPVCANAEQRTEGVERVEAPTYDGLYSGKWQHATVSGHG